MNADLCLLRPLALSLRSMATLMGVPPESSDAAHAVERWDVKTTAVPIVAGAAAIFALRESVSLLAPLLVSVLLAYALEPFVSLCCRCRLPRPFAVVIVCSLVVAGVATTGGLARRQIAAFIAALPVTVRELQDSLARARWDAVPPDRPGAIENLQRVAIEVKAALEASSRPPSGVARVTPIAPRFNLRTYLAHASIAAAVTLLRLAAIALLTLLLLLGGEALKRKLIAMAGPRAQKKVTHDVIKAIDRQIERYLVARLLISALVAGATWLGLWWLGLRQPLVLGLIAGVLNVLPFIGPVAAVAVVAVVAFLQFHAIGITAAAVGVAGAVAALEGNLVSPWLTSRAGELNTVAVFVSVLFWGWMWDVWGLVLAIPIMVAIKAAADHIEPLQPLGELLGR
jgi:predicted PurR-regulated permease PerM